MQDATEVIEEYIEQVYLNCCNVFSQFGFNFRACKQNKHAEIGFPDHPYATYGMYKENKK